MSVEGIRKLVQCENQAKERLKLARKEQEIMKAQAHKDAMESVKKLEVKNKERLESLEQEVNKYIEMVKEKLEEDLKIRSDTLSNVQSKEAIIESLVKHITCYKK